MNWVRNNAADLRNTITKTLWRHDMGTLLELPLLCESIGRRWFPSQRDFTMMSDVGLNKLLIKQSSCPWYEMLIRWCYTVISITAWKTWHHAKLSQAMRAPWMDRFDTIKFIVILCLKYVVDLPSRPPAIAQLKGIVTSGQQQCNEPTLHWRHSGVMASQITVNWIVYSKVCSGDEQRNTNEKMKMFKQI